MEFGGLISSCNRVSSHPINYLMCWNLFTFPFLSSFQGMLLFRHLIPFCGVPISNEIMIISTESTQHSFSSIFQISYFQLFSQISPNIIQKLECLQQNILHRIYNGFTCFAFWHPIHIVFNIFDLLADQPRSTKRWNSRFYLKDDDTWLGGRITVKQINFDKSTTPSRHHSTLWLQDPFNVTVISVFRRICTEPMPVGCWHVHGIDV